MNLKLPVFIHSITNLSDARFFSAYGVDWLSFDRSPNSTLSLPIEQIKEITNWVEGPQIAFNVVNCSTDEIKQFQSEFDVDGFVLDEFQNQDWSYTGQEMFTTILIQPNLDWTDLAKRIESLHTNVLIDCYTNQVQISEEEIRLIGQIQSKFSIFLDGKLMTNHLDQLVKHSNCGIVLHGGEEEKVGIRSFDEVQDIMEYLSA